MAPIAVIGKQGKSYKKDIDGNWNPKYESIVGLAISGVTKREIVKQTGMSLSQVESILRSPRAQQLKAEAILRVRKYYEGELEKRTRIIGGMALDQLEAAFGQEWPAKLVPAILAQANKFLDMSGLITPEWKKKESTPASTTNIKNAIIVKKEEFDDLNSGLKKADEVAKRLKEIPANVR